MTFCWLHEFARKISLSCQNCQLFLTPALKYQTIFGKMYRHSTFTLKDVLLDLIFFWISSKILYFIIDKAKLYPVLKQNKTHSILLVCTTCFDQLKSPFALRFWKGLYCAKYITHTLVFLVCTTAFSPDSTFYSQLSSAVVLPIQNKPNRRQGMQACFCFLSLSVWVEVFA